MKSRRSSIDGFAPRQSGNTLGERHREKKIVAAKPTSSQTRIVVSGAREQPHASSSVKPLGRSDIDESLSSIDAAKSPKNLSRRQRRKLNKRSKKPKSKVRRIIKWIILIIIIGLLGFGGYYVYKANHAFGKAFKGNIFQVFTQPNVALQQDSNGRTNILVLGTSEDDPGHQGSDLTDSMMIMSLDQTHKNAYLISIPRDLWVQYNQACASGYEGKINVYYSCEGGDTSVDSVDADRTALTKEASFVGSIFGLTIQYGVNVNYTVFRDVVNAVGGSITVDIQSRDAAGIMDSNFDWKCGATEKLRIANCPPDGHYIQYPNGPATLDAEHALYLAQARGDSAPTYGFEQSNFDREKNQQMIIKAIRDKALSEGIFANPTAITNIINSLGDNLRTTFQADEVKTLVALASSITDANIKSVSLIDAVPAVVTTGDVDGQSSVEPSDGLYDYSGIQALIAKSLSSNPLIREGANVAVLNGSGVAGAAQTQADALTAAGYTVSDVDSADTTNYTGYTVYAINKTDPDTQAALAKLYKVTVKTTTPPFTVPTGADFVVIVGATPSSSQSSSN
jgi:anionic cell wall polymer biosynthesis LytR-Cps2A-Psr (LCP) family protein